MLIDCCRLAGVVCESACSMRSSTADVNTRLSSVPPPPTRWGFDGYVTSDCDADNDVVFSHHYTDDPLQGVQDVLRAGKKMCPLSQTAMLL